MLTPSPTPDIYGPNICLAITDQSTLAALDRSEKEHPSPKKTLPDGRVIHTSHEIESHLDPSSSSSSPDLVLIDFGNCQIREGDADHPLVQDVKHKMSLRQMHPIRDIRWVGRMFCDIIAGRTLFYVDKKGNRERVSEEKVGEMRRFLEVMRDCEREQGLSAGFLLGTMPEEPKSHGPS